MQGKVILVYAYAWANYYCPIDALTHEGQTHVTCSVGVIGCRH